MIFQFTGNVYIPDKTLDKIAEEAQTEKSVDDVIDKWIDILFDEDDQRIEYVRTQIVDYIWDKVSMGE